MEGILKEIDHRVVHGCNETQEKK